MVRASDRTAKDRSARSAPELRRTCALVAVILALACGSGRVQAQSVSGRISDAESSRPVGGAAVSVNGRRIVSNAEGLFTMKSVYAGPVTVSVQAFGYKPWQSEFVWARDTTLLIALQPDALALDSIVGKLRTVKLRGEVRDSATGMIVVDATVHTDGGSSTRTGNIGRYSVRLAKDVATNVTYEAFTYLPRNVTVKSEHDSTLHVSLRYDSIALRMIDVQLKKIETRGYGQRAAGKYSISHADLMNRGSVKFRQQLEHQGFLRRVTCLMIDDVQVLEMRRLDGLLPDRVERVERLYRGGMLRIYTRDYVMRMLGGGITLRTPYMNAYTSPPTCR